MRTRSGASSRAASTAISATCSTTASRASITRATRSSTRDRRSAFARCARTSRSCRSTDAITSARLLESWGTWITAKRPGSLRTRASTCSCRCITTRSRRTSDTQRTSSTLCAAIIPRSRSSFRRATDRCCTRRHAMARSATRRFLASAGLPDRDLGELPDSAKRFPDGAHYRVEIPSTEGPRALAAVLDEAERRGVPVVRVSQGSGVFMQTDDELDEMARLGANAGVELSLFARPNAGWDTSAMARAPVGPLVAPVARGTEQLVAVLEDVRRAAAHGIRSVLIQNLGGFVRFHEIADIVRVGAPVYLKFGLRGTTDPYPAGSHLEATLVAMSRERVRRARLGLDLLEREASGLYETSLPGAAGLAVPAEAVLSIRS